MKNLYLKEIEFNDLNLLIDYNNDFKKYFPNFKNSINENTFNDWLKEIKESQKDEFKMHVYPYWLMKGEKAIGLPILKTNIEVNEEYKKLCNFSKLSNERLWYTLSSFSFKRM